MISTFPHFHFEIHDVSIVGIDEFEGVGGKEKTAIRELLNSSYKRGTKIFRMKKQKTKDKEPKAKNKRSETKNQKREKLQQENAKNGKTQETN